MNEDPTTRGTDRYNENTKKVITAIREEADLSFKAGGKEYGNRKVEQMTMEDYSDACREFIGKDEILSDELLNSRIQYLLQEGKLKQYLPTGYRCCVAVIPCSQYGFPLEDEQIEQGQHVRNLIVEKDKKTGDNVIKGRTVAGFTLNTSRIFDLLPKEIQERCTFEIAGYENSDPYELTDRDRQMIAGLYAHAFREAQKLLNKSEGKSQN